MLKFLKNLKSDIENLKDEVYKNGDQEYFVPALITRVESIENSLKAIKDYLDITADWTDYEPEVKSKMFYRKATKKDKQPKKGSWLDINLKDF